MIARLTGRCVHVDAESLIIDVGGVGYLVRATAAVIDAARRTPDEVVVHVHTSVREDAIQLYGFASPAEQAVFEHLTALQGVGPKVAIAVLSCLSPHDVRRAADAEDVALLQSVPGVGPKVARRIVTELRDKLGELLGNGGTVLSARVEDVSEHGSAAPGGDATWYEARAALVQLGLSPIEAEALLVGTDPGTATSQRVRQALAGKVGL